MSARKSRVGDVHRAGALFLAIHAGEATDEESGEGLYSLSVSASGYSPIVRSTKTGKSFTLSWKQIIALAEAAGINR